MKLPIKSIEILRVLRKETETEIDLKLVVDNFFNLEKEISNTTWV